MGVYIRGLKIEGKKFCPFQDAEYGYCLISEDEKGNLADCHALVKCPYEIVPDHGDLIEKDYLMKKCDAPHWCVWLNEIEDAPVVIPAERSEDGET